MVVSKVVCLVRGDLLGLRATWRQGVSGSTGEAGLDLGLLCYGALIQQQKSLQPNETDVVENNCVVQE